MKVVQVNEAFKTVGRKFKFSYVQYFVQQDGALYHGKWHDRHQAPEALEQLDEVRQIQTEDRGPAIRSTWSLIYIKKPNLLTFASGLDLETLILNEVAVCEILRENPHPNIASYYGCEETRGLVSGLCFKRYVSTLLQKVNPQYLSKEHFRSSKREHVDAAARGSLDGILKGIKHLHSLGLVHNDINPANIMFDERDTPVLVDFDSCRKIGESLHDPKTKRTHEWHDPRVETALEKNDLDAFEELRIWLVGSVGEKFLFQ
ncbi:kinase-like protein [Aspergillus coremiiformis]|uniref:Kinase-like protein n=1 Tax=Aspergillus coremiiformis TaxID=138285 RepID=A0A5N6ZH79_9EURO|nr:kinase-like protein [Aspergillus coremiiformis]